MAIVPYHSHVPQMILVVILVARFLGPKQVNLSVLVDMLVCIHMYLRRLLTRLLSCLGLYIKPWLCTSAMLELCAWSEISHMHHV